MDGAAQSEPDPTSPSEVSRESCKKQDSENFNWLASAFRGPAYNSYSLFSHLPATAFDWGDGGYAGSSNCGGNLMCLSALSTTDDSAGLIVARGNFSTSPYASLSRAQADYGGPATFGLEISRADHKYDPSGDELTRKGSSFQLGSMIERGAFNHRWPVTEYYLDLYEDDHQVKDIHVGTCQIFSYTRRGVFYQVLRIEEGGNMDRSKDSWRRFPPQSQIVLTMGGPVWFHTFQARDRLHDLMLNSNTDQIFDMNEYPPADPPYLRGYHDPKTAQLIRFWDRTRSIGLEANVYQYRPNKHGDEPYRRLSLAHSAAAADNGPDEVQGEFRVRAYNAIVPLTREVDQDHVHIFVAAIRLFEGEGEFEVRHDWNPLARLPSSEEMHSHLNIDPSSENATGAMWDTIFTEQREEWDSLLDFAEVSLVGRTLEKILQVDVIPAPFYNPRLQAGARMETSALVSNLFIQPTIDLKATFWKVRFLYMTYKYLSSLCKLHESSPSYREESKTGTDDGLCGDGSSSMSSRHPSSDIVDMLRVASSQLTRIEGAIDKIIRYIVWALLDPNWNTKMMPDNHIAGDPSYFYVMTTIWFIVKAFPDWAWDWKDLLLSLNNGEKGIHLIDKTRLPPENWTFGNADKELVPLLRWYHYGSVLNLCERGFLSQSWCTDDLDRKVLRLEKAAKLAAAAKLSSGRPYSANDEIIDRLSLVSDELELERFKSGRISLVTKLAVDRIKQRVFTRELNPGWSSSHEQESTSGPWEIYALCHHSCLAALFLNQANFKAVIGTEAKKDSLARTKHDIRCFLNGEGTIFPYWGRGQREAREGWLCSEASAVFGTTILAANKENMEIELAADVASSNKKNKLGSLFITNELDQSTLLQSLFKDRITDQLDERLLPKSIDKTERAPPIQWKTFSMPRRYHPESFINSLEDTPELYAAPLIGNTFVPIPLRGFLTSPNTPNLMFTQDSLNPILKDIFVSDITADYYTGDPGGLAWKVRHLEYATVDEKGKEPPGSLLKWALYDSLVDQEVQHRFLTVRCGGERRRQSIPQEHLDLLFYVLHTESAACLSNHLLQFNQFSYQGGDSWIANITLRCWVVCRNGPDAMAGLRRARRIDTQMEKRIMAKDRVARRPIDMSSIGRPQYRKTDDEPIYLPMNLKEVWETTESPTLSFELEISSIILSTNTFGDFSKCTIISDLISKKEIGRVVEEARLLWQKFIHQSQTSRCLVFLLVLETLCQKIAENYNVAIDKLKSIQELDTSFTRSEQEWSSNPYLNMEFEMGLWSLEALHKLQYNLKASIGSVLDAKELLGAQIEAGPGTRSPALERMCHEGIRRFEGSLLKLTTINARLERTIELNERYQASFSAVLKLRDSRVANSSVRQNKILLSQGETIQILTYVTIAYLPMTLMASIFTIPPDQQVIFPTMGLGWFVGAIILLSLATFLVAFFMHDIMYFFKKLTSHSMKAESHEVGLSPKTWFRQRITGEAEGLSPGILLPPAGGKRLRPQILSAPLASAEEVLEVKDSDVQPEVLAGVLGRVRRIHFARSRRSTSNTNGIDGVAP